MLLWAFVDMGRAVRNVGHLTCMSSAEVERGAALPSYFRSQTVNKCPFLPVCSVSCFHILVLFIGDFTVEWAPSHHAQVLSGVPKSRKAVVCLPKERCAFDGLHSGMSTVLFTMSLMSWMDNVLNKTSFSRNTRKTRFCVNRLTKIWPEARRNLTLPFP